MRSLEEVSRLLAAADSGSVEQAEEHLKSATESVRHLSVPDDLLQALRQCRRIAALLSSGRQFYSGLTQTSSYGSKPLVSPGRRFSVEA